MGTEVAGAAEVEAKRRARRRQDDGLWLLLAGAATKHKTEQGRMLIFQPSPLSSSPPIHLKENQTFANHVGKWKKPTKNRCPTNSNVQAPPIGT